MHNEDVCAHGYGVGRRVLICHFVRIKKLESLLKSLERHLKYFGLVDDGGKAITFPEWATLAQVRAGWLKLVTKAPFTIGKLQLRPPRCNTRVTPEEKRRFLARSSQESEQRRALLNAETDAETT